MTVAHIGTSGWQYRDWRGPFYPSGEPIRRWLSFYATVFSTVEVNNTFYRLPPRSTFEHWREGTPSGFTIATKASRFLTHVRRLREPQDPVDRMLTRLAALGTRRGPLLLQLPPTLRADVQLLQSAMQAIDRRVPTAVEFRHPTWFRDAVFDTLEEAEQPWCSPIGPVRASRRSSRAVGRTFASIEGRRTEPGTGARSSDDGRTVSLPSGSTKSTSTSTTTRVPRRHTMRFGSARCSRTEGWTSA
jgi:hypothetical protein